MGNVKTMRFHTIHLPATNFCTQVQNENHLLRQMDEIVAVKEGFCWPAFLFSLVWATFHRLWLFAFSLMGLCSVTFFTLYQQGAEPSFNLIVCFGIFVLFGYHANDFRRFKLRRAGYLERGIILAPTVDAAVQRYLRTLFLRR